ncbi:hypothetical protein [Nostoc sp.]|uniref:hypothetical protein n=1 Tax=Nostoc sp. TaxID=1180 RepID=UPI002FFBD0FC
MKLDSHRPDFAMQERRHNLVGLQRFRASTWVNLWQLPNPFSFDEALLLSSKTTTQKPLAAYVRHPMTVNDACYRK